MDWRYPKILSGQTPLPNPNFIANATLLRGIGWPDSNTDWTRQMALVSPRHFLYASHYTLTPSWQIIFVGTDGNQHVYGIESQTPILNDQGQQTDLMVVTLTASVNASVGITPFPVLNLPSEADYVGKPLLISGSVTDTGTGTIGGHTTLETEEPGFNTTRFIYFDYDKNVTGTANDCTYWYGDSGAPAFVMVNGQPALAGTASGFDDLTPNDGIEGPVFRNYMASIHTYLPQVDAIMEAKGYHLKRFYPAATTVATTTTAVGTLRQAKPGSVSIVIGNSGSQAAHNVDLLVTFTTAPVTVAGAGWICTPVTPLVWKCLRGGIAGTSSATVTATWANLPNTSSQQITVLQNYDGGAPVTTSTNLSVAPSYNAWIQDTTEAAHHSDPDHDGIANLAEYAFGGSPNQASLSSPDGRSLLPRVETVNGNLLVHFPWRTDSAIRGLDETVEFSNNLSDWQTAFPEGVTVNTAAYSPASEGFEEMTVNIPATSLEKFVRVKVTLEE